MQEPTGKHRQVERFAARDATLLAREIQRKGREVLADLGLTDEEIAAYYGGPDRDESDVPPAPVQ